MLFYLVGAVIVFVVVLLVGVLSLVYQEEGEDRDVLDLLTSLIIFPWFSWLFILVVSLIVLVLHLKNKKEENVTRKD